MEEFLTCRLCGIQKLITEYSVVTKNKSGRDSRCKKCRNSEYLKNRDSKLAQAKVRYVENKDSILKRSQDRYIENRVIIRTNFREKRQRNDSCRVKAREYKKNRKEQAYSKLGGFCVGCKEDDIRVLCVDHIYDDGSSERHRGTGLVGVYGLIIAGSDRYQLLCYNCNLKKQIKRELVYGSVGILKRCVTCNLDLDSGFFKNHSGCSDGRYYECRKCVSDRLMIFKIQALNKLGQARCRTCGIQDIDVLSVDHINEDGHRTRLQDGIGSVLYRQIVSNKVDLTRFQVLCLNCNLYKHKKIKSGSTNVEFQKPLPCVTSESSLCVVTVNDAFNLKDLSIRVCSDSIESVKLLDSHHYGGYGRHGSIHIGAYLGQNIVACAKFASPVRMEVAKSMGVEYSKVLELDRFCIDPKYQKKNLASYFLSRIVPLIKRINPSVTHLVSFADPSYGHSGVIYKAANWKFVHTTSRSYEYVDLNGQRIHKKTVYNQARSVGLKESEFSSKHRLTRSYTLKKLKYALNLR